MTKETGAKTEEWTRWIPATLRNPKCVKQDDILAVVSAGQGPQSAIRLNNFYLDVDENSDYETQYSVVE